MGAGASSEKHDRDVLPEAEASVVNRYHIYHAKSMGDEREEWEKHLVPEKAERNGTAPGVLRTPSKASITDPEVVDPPGPPAEESVDAEAPAALSVPA